MKDYTLLYNNSMLAVPAIEEVAQDVYKQADISSSIKR
jgi:hypothetical protein